MCRSITLTSLRDASEEFRNPNFGQLFHAQIEDDWGHQVHGLVLGYDQIALKDSIFIKRLNRLLYYRQPFRVPTSVQALGPDCKVEYTDANNGIIPESHNIWVDYTDSDLNDTFHGHFPSLRVSYLSRTPPNQILQFQQRLPTGRTISTLSERFKNTQQWILFPEAQAYAVAIRTKYNDRHGWADCVDTFIRVVKQTDIMHIVPLEQLLDRHICCERMLQQIESIPYGL